MVEVSRSGPQRGGEFIGDHADRTPGPHAQNRDGQLLGRGHRQYGHVAVELTAMTDHAAARSPWVFEDFGAQSVVRGDFGGKFHRASRRENPPAIQPIAPPGQGRSVGRDAAGGAGGAGA